MLPIVEHYDCNWCIKWLGFQLVVIRPEWVFWFQFHFSLDADGLFAISTPYFILYFPQWFYNWLYRNEVRDA